MKNSAKLLVGLSLVLILGSVATSALQVIPQETGASNPVDVSGPPYDGQYKDTSAQIPPNSVMDWWGDVDGGFITWQGQYRLCFEFIIYGAGPNGEDLVTSSPCDCTSFIVPDATRTPLPTLTPTLSPTPTRTPTPRQ